MSRRTGIGLGPGFCRFNSTLPPLIAEASAILSPNTGIEAGTGGVSAWRNKLGTAGSALDALQTNSAKRPDVDATGGRSGGPAVRFVSSSADQLDSAAFTLNQPSTAVVVAKPNVLGGTICDGRTGNTRRIYLAGSQATIYAGTALATATGMTTGTWYKLAGVYNGGSSIARRDASTATGNAGTAAASGFTLGNFGTTGGAAFDGWIEWYLLWSRALSSGELGEVFAWLG